MNRRSLTRLALVAAVAVVVVETAAVVTVLSTPKIAEITPSLLFMYDQGGIDWNPFVEIWGKVYDNGSKAVDSCTLHLAVEDSRGWSINRTIELGRIESHSSVFVNAKYDWPWSYNGQNLTSGPELRDFNSDYAPDWTWHLTIS